MLKVAVGVTLEWSKQDETGQSDRSDREHDTFRESREEFQNLQIEQNRRVPKRTDDTVKEARCEQCLGQINKPEEHSLKLRTNWSMDEVERKLQMTPPSSDTMSEDRTSDFSEPSRTSLENKDNNVSVPKLSWINSMTQIVGLTAAWHQGKTGGDFVGTNIAGSPKVYKMPVHAEFNFFL